MRTFTRQVNQGLVIGENLHVTVLEIQEHYVRLAVECPDQDPSYWEEVLFVESPAAVRQPVEVF